MGSEIYTYQIIADAENDIDEIVKHISVVLSNPEAAEKFLADLEQKLEQLCEMPKMGKIVENEFNKRKDFRRVIINNYDLYYFINDEDRIINVLRVVSARRDQHLILSSIIK
ncbi:MAG: type II toxin-antitoxin system RelE/ParE family toxin [Anaerolineaceae bacterium]|nr:type II toxin-antitoxin system RelE/ParE family toxin [Anaerolineaceae bacterium]